MSMEEQRQRQEDEQRRALAESDPNAAGGSTVGTGVAAVAAEPATEEAMLQRALALSTETPVKRIRVRTISILIFVYFLWTNHFPKKNYLKDSCCL